MPSSQHLNITLAAEMADVIQTKIRSGEYATESEVIHEGLRALMERDRVQENWLQSQVGPAYDALKADASRAVPIDQVRARLAAELASAKAQ